MNVDVEKKERGDRIGGKAKGKAKEECRRGKEGERIEERG
jgi:hypothetical protein